MSIPYIAKQDSVTLFVKGRGVTVANDHSNFKEIIKKLENGDENADEFMSLIDVVKSIGAKRVETPEAAAASRDVTFDVSTGALKYKGFPLSGYIATKAAELHRAGSPKPLQKFLAFLENLYSNPRSSIAERLYRFLEVGNMPITDDGYFLAYKKVRNDYKDIHSGTMDNSVGKILEMPRVLVNDKDTETCSTGLHFCSYAYLGQFGSGNSNNRVLVLKINPADVVSIPVDYNDTKGRTCRYEVLSEITDEAAKGPVLSQGPAIVSATAYRPAASVVSPVMQTPAYTAQDAATARASATVVGGAVAVPSVWPTPVHPAAATGAASVVPSPTTVVQSSPFAVAVQTQLKGRFSDAQVEAALSQKSNVRLAVMWNQMAIHPIDHFRDKATGIKRLMALTDRATLERLAGL